MESLIARWREIIQDREQSWVLFRNGTCVTVHAAAGDPVDVAIALMKEWGPVQVATPSADFNVAELPDGTGWVVTCHHQDINTFVSRDEMASASPPEVFVGLTGRAKRDQDAQELQIIHLEKATAEESRPPGTASCSCLDEPQGQLIPFRELGMDSHYAEVSILVCRQCGQYWLRYFYESEFFSHSGRWYLGPISEERAKSLIAEDAKQVMEGLSWYYYGGSYFGGRGGKSSGEIWL